MSSILNYLPFKPLTWRSTGYLRKVIIICINVKLEKRNDLKTNNKQIMKIMSGLVHLRSKQFAVWFWTVEITRLQRKSMNIQQSVSKKSSLGHMCNTCFIIRLIVTFVVNMSNPFLWLRTGSKCRRNTVSNNLRTASPVGVLPLVESWFKSLWPWVRTVNENKTYKTQPQTQ